MENKLHKNSDRISNSVREFQTKNSSGFTVEEIRSLLEKFTSVDMEKFDRALFGITCRSINGETVIYPWDVEKALRCGLEKRDLREAEWD